MNRPAWFRAEVYEQARVVQCGEGMLVLGTTVATGMQLGALTAVWKDGKYSCKL